MSQRSDFLTKLADLMEEHGVYSIDADTQDGSDARVQIDFNDQAPIDLMCQWAYVSDIRKIAAHHDVSDLLEGIK